MVFERALTTHVHIQKKQLKWIITYLVYHGPWTLRCFFERASQTHIQIIVLLLLSLGYNMHDLDLDPEGACAEQMSYHSKSEILGHEKYIRIREIIFVHAIGMHLRRVTNFFNWVTNQLQRTNTNFFLSYQLFKIKLPTYSIELPTSWMQNII